MFSVSFKTPPSLNRFLDCLKPGGRRLMFSAAAAAVSDLVRRHIADDSARRHVHALTDGAGKRTRFMEKAARKTVFHADETHGEVVIPSPGFGRAFHDVTITPTHGAALTLPVHELAYGRRVKEMSSLGWMIFRPKGKDVLMGYQKNMTLKNGQKTAVPLYLLKKRVQQRQDRSLLPSDVKLYTTASRAMMS